jgi:glucose/arabinose dehydrogenase
MHNKAWMALCLLLSLGLSLAGCAATTPAPEPAGATSAPSAPSSTPTVRPAPATPASPTETATSSPTEQPPSPPTEPPQPSATEQPQPTLAPIPDVAAVRVDLKSVATGLDQPVSIANAADGTGRLFIVEKPGRIRVLQDGKLSSVVFLDITDRVGSQGNEQGLLGLAFHPDFAHNPFFFVDYTDRQGNTVVSRLALSSDPAQADPASEVVILTVDQPAANHNGGQLAFGPDGLLYIGLGDGGGAGDPSGNGQNTKTLLAKILRLDVNHGRPYAVPGTNPFVGSAGSRSEIWATGLRNPWRFSFDRLTGDLYIADVGQNKYEEIDYQPAGSPGGENYGWSIMEGNHCYRPGANCDRTGLTLPVAEYSHSQGCSVTGGFVYRGRQFPSLDGIYFYSDYCSGRIWAMARDGQGAWRTAEVGQANIQPSTFGEDESGELYLADLREGRLYQVVALP